jgi:DNA-binding transcriptional ArsR family regulator
MAQASVDAAELLPEATRDFLKALASETRQQILMLFIGGTALTVGEVAERLDIGQSTASEHLTLLRRGGLLTPQRHGKQVSYRADPVTVSARLAQLQEFLRCCCPPADDKQQPPQIR